GWRNTASRPSSGDAPPHGFMGHLSGLSIRRASMSIHGTAIRAAAALVALSAPAIALAQAPDGAAPRRLSPELEALNPPVPDDIVVPEERLVPAEKKAAAYIDPDWVGPRTSWGHPSLEGTWATDDMRGIPFDRPVELASQEFLN